MKEKSTAYGYTALHPGTHQVSQKTSNILPKENRLGQKGTGFMKLMEKLQQERLLVATLANTMAAFALDWTIEFLRTQSASNGSGKQSQTVQFALVEMSTEIKLGRTFLEKLIADHMEGCNIVSETSMAKF